jgi:hypothetical protein
MGSWSNAAKRRRQKRRAERARRRERDRKKGDQMSADANFLVWRRGLRGPEASLDHLDPRNMNDWKQNEDRTIKIFTLTDQDRAMSLDTLKVLYPCAEISS